MPAPSRRPRNKKAMLAALARELLQRGVPRLLGLRLVSAAPKKITATMRIEPMHINRSGRVSGGAIMAFADVLGALGTVANLPPGHRTATLESKTNFFAAGTGPALKAVSIPLHIGRTTMVWQTTVSNPDGRAVAVVTQTQIVIPADPRAEADRAKPPSKTTKRRR